MRGVCLIVAQHLFGPADSGTQAVLKLAIPSTLLNVLGDGRTDDLGYWLFVDGRNCFQLLSLFSRKSDGHSFCRLHST